MYIKNREYKAHNLQLNIFGAWIVQAFNVHKNLFIT